jgi:hypothetical protein
MNKISDYNWSAVGIDSGSKLKEFICNNDVDIEHTTQIDNSENCIYIFDGSSFNWKSRQNIVRFNCNKIRKENVEKLLDKKAIDNSGSHSKRTWSFIIESSDELLKLLSFLKLFQGNK